MAGALRIGIAVGPGGLTALIPGRPDSPVTVPLTLPTDRNDLVKELLHSLQAVGAQLEAGGLGRSRGARVSVTILPPLADARVVELPPLRREEAEAVLRRDAGRHFLVGAGPMAVGVAPGGRASGEDGSVPLLAAAAPLALLEALEVACEQAGWSVDSMGPGHGAWLGAAEAIQGGGAEAVVSVLGDACYVLRSDVAGRPSVRRVSRGDVPAVAAALGPGPGRALVLAETPDASALSDALASAGWTALRDPEGWPGAAESAAARAGAGPLELVPPALAARRRERTRSSALRLAVVAAAFVVAALGARLWGVHRELGAVQARRAEIASQVGPLLTTRDSVQSLVGRVRIIEDLATSSPRWTPVLVELAGLLPRDAYLTALYASGDTLEVEAAGSRAGEAILSLRGAGLFEDVRLQGIVERELENGETVVERFRVQATLVDGLSEGGGGAP